tara:strand:- start:301543 stop:301866 length:324 start_codon:yes stop_codon:yes gene_type:complete
MPAGESYGIAYDTLSPTCISAESGNSPLQVFVFCYGLALENSNDDGEDNANAKSEGQQPRPQEPKQEDCLDEQRVVDDANDNDNDAQNDKNQPENSIAVHEGSPFAK